MEISKTAVLETQTLSRTLVRLALGVLFLAISFVVPLIGVQLITGTIVNATLIIAVILLGLPSAVAIAFAPNVISLAIGKLPLAFAPMIPNIIIGNIILIVLFKIIARRSIFGAALTASVAKFAFIYMSSLILINLVASQSLTKLAASMMGTVQLITALLGSALAIGVLTAAKKLKK